MPSMISDDRLLYDILAIGVAVLALAWFIVWLTRSTARRRPGLHLGRALAVAAAARLATAALFAAVPSLRPLRGPDEMTFLNLADRLTYDGSALGDLPRGLASNLQVVYMAFWEFLFDAASDYPLRVAHIALAIAAIGVVAIAVNDLAGPRAGVVSAWILALEPNNVFFSGILHKEAPMLLGEAVVILGAVRMYQRRDPLAVALMVVGLAIAGFTRPYAGVALAAACLAICLHAALRRLGEDGRRAPRLTVVLALTAVAAVVVVASSSARVLSALQTSQNANVTDTSNLRLEPVDYSSVGSTVRNIGPRIGAVLLRPYPWQAANTSQRFGVVGTLIAWTVLLVTTVLVVTRFRLAVARLPPLLYVLAMLTIVYALSAGNAGTGFRYRTHLLVGMTAVMVTLAYSARRSDLRYGSRG